MRGFIQAGEQLEFTAPALGVTSGVPVLIGRLLVVPSVSALVGERFNGRTCGVFEYTKIASQAWTEGQNLYWDTRVVGSGGQRFTSDPTQGPLVGAAVEVVGGGAGEVEGIVRLNGTTSALLEGGAEAALADLTDSSGGAAADGTIGIVTIPTALTGAGSGTANGALEAEGTLATAGGNTYSDAAVNTILAKIENNITELVAQQTANITALTACRDAIKELATKQNATLATLRLSGLIAP